MTKRRDIPVSRIEALLANSMGNVSAVAKSLNVSRSTLYARINESPRLRQVLIDSRETLLDIAESIMAQKIMAGDNDILKFFLRTQGKRRGYTYESESAISVVTYSIDDWRRELEHRRRQADAALAVLDEDEKTDDES